MNEYVIDPGVAMKWFFPEPNAAGALRFLESESLLIVPDILFAEVAGVVRKRVRAGELAHEDGEEIVRAIDLVPFEVHTSRSFLEPAYEIAGALDCSIQDALYLAVAIARRCRLVTSDRKLFTSVEKTPFGENVAWVGDEA